jgi:GTPase
MNYYPRTMDDKLVEVAKRRELFRRQRSREGLASVSLAGYTSAGKTTLFNTLVGEYHDTGKGMFTTLSTYTRAINVNNRKVLLSDTVGFISKLPAYMIEAFRSTLEELTFADLVLLVIDGSEPLHMIKKKYHSSTSILNELQVSEGRLLYVFNKLDLVDEESIMKNARALNINIERCIALSAKYAKNIDILVDKIGKALDFITPYSISETGNNNDDYSYLESLRLDME